MFMLNKDWVSIDKDTEHVFVNNIEFVRPKNIITLKLYCESCNTLISSIEDCENLKIHNVCESCFVNKSFINKDNTYN